uniref:Uncharacterized protein n=1 Tax=Cannabis sativa TaxID=3483 RepID=A0A803R9I7_CANSA
MVKICKSAPSRPRSRKMKQYFTVYDKRNDEERTYESTERERTVEVAWGLSKNRRGGLWWLPSDFENSRSRLKEREEITRACEVACGGCLRILKTLNQK